MRVRDWVLVVTIAIVLAATLLDDGGIVRNPTRRVLRALVRAINVVRPLRDGRRDDLRQCVDERQIIEDAQTMQLANQEPHRQVTAGGNVTIDHGYGW